MPRAFCSSSKSLSSKKLFHQSLTQPQPACLTSVGTRREVDIWAALVQVTAPGTAGEEVRSSRRRIREATAQSIQWEALQASFQKTRKTPRWYPRKNKDTEEMPASDTYCSSIKQTQPNSSPSKQNLTLKAYLLLASTSCPSFNKKLQCVLKGETNTACRDRQRIRIGLSYGGNFGIWGQGI